MWFDVEVEVEANDGEEAENKALNVAEDAINKANLMLIDSDVEWVEEQ